MGKRKTPAKPAKKYELTDEHRRQLKPWADRWIVNAMRTGLLSAEEREQVRTAVRGMYAAANLPPPMNIVFAAGPVTGALAASIAAGVWYLRSHPEFYGKLATGAETRVATYAETRAATYAETRAATDDATYAETRAATDAATRAETRVATYAETGAAIYAATRAATYAATRAATDAETRAATGAATYAETRATTDDATYAATCAAIYAATDAETRAATDAETRVATDDATYAETRAATDAETRDATTRFLLGCCAGWDNLRNGGNQWSGWVCFLSFFRHIAQLPIDYSKWDHYEVAAIAGPRYMTPDFCIVSEPPLVLRVDDRNLPHCEDGPSHRWADGIELYYWHGVKVPRRWVLERKTVPVVEILAEQNADIRTAGLQMVGWPRILAELTAKAVDVDDPEIGTLYSVDLPNEPGQRILMARCGTGRDVALRVPPTMKTALEANAWTWGLSPEEYKPEVRT